MSCVSCSTTGSLGSKIIVWSSFFDIFYSINFVLGNKDLRYSKHRFFFSRKLLNAYGSVTNTRSIFFKEELRNIWPYFFSKLLSYCEGKLMCCWHSEVLLALVASPGRKPASEDLGRQVVSYDYNSTADEEAEVTVVWGGGAEERVRDRVRSHKRVNLGWPLWWMAWHQREQDEEKCYFCFVRFRNLC